jgi:hypothetical protein
MSKGGCVRRNIHRVLFIIQDPKQPIGLAVVSGAASVNRRYSGCLAAFRERSGRLAFRAVIALGASVAQK